MRRNSGKGQFARLFTRPRTLLFLLLVLVKFTPVTLILKACFTRKVPELPETLVNCLLAPRIVIVSLFSHKTSLLRIPYLRTLRKVLSCLTSRQNGILTLLKTLFGSLIRIRRVRHPLTRLRTLLRSMF